jgi:hypothetical protein
MSMSEVGCTDIRSSLHAVGLIRFGGPGWAPRGVSSQELARLQVQAGDQPDGVTGRIVELEVAGQGWST